ncbi:Npt1/Npt2 family nucleotide transporter [Candidatus Cardinium hertigii]
MTKANLLSKVKALFRPIIEIQYANEKKIGGLLVLKFLLALVYCILAGIKDTLLITAHSSSAEVIPIIKGAIIFPLSIVVVIFYTKLDNHFKQSTLFYSTILFFLCCILLYCFLLYPNAYKGSPNIIADRLTIYSDGKHLHWIAIFRHWIHVLFFIIAELWGQVVLMVLYWNFANSICTVDEGKKYYGILIAAGDLPLIITAQLIQVLLKKNVPFLLTVQSLARYIVVLCVLILFTYWWVNKTINKNPGNVYHSRAVSTKIRLSLRESFHYIICSKYLTHLAMMVISCAFSVNLMEATWKSYIKDVFPKSIDYQNFSSSVAFWSGIFALATSLFLTRGFIEKFGWGKAIKIVPISIAIMGCSFFLMSYAKNSVPFLQNSIGTSFARYIAWWGGVQSIVIRVVKYAFFDKTIQIAYIPLAPSIKVKGKTAVDILGSNIGKAGSAWIQIGLLELFNTNSLQNISLILFMLLLIISICWYKSINYVDHHLTTSTR